MKAKPIFPDVFFRNFLQNLRSGITWPANIEMMIENENYPIIIDKIIAPSYFYGKETHLTLVNLYQENVASFRVEELLCRLNKIFRNIPFKYRLTLEDSEHHCYGLTTQTDLRQMELKVRASPWWRIIFANLGFKNRKRYNLQREMKRFDKPNYRRKFKKEEPIVKDLIVSKNKGKKNSRSSKKGITRPDSCKREALLPVFPVNHPKSYLFSSPSPSTSLTLTQNVSNSLPTSSSSSFVQKAGENLPSLLPLQILMGDLHPSDEENL